MNRFKIFILSGVITVLCSHFAWAGTIDSISVNEETRAVAVLVTLCESSLVESEIRTTLEGGIFKASLTAHADSFISCDSKFLVTFNIPVCVEFNGIGAFLYAPDGHGAMPSDIGMGVDDTMCVPVESNFLAAADMTTCNDTYTDCVDVCEAQCANFFGGCYGDNVYKLCEGDCKANLDDCATPPVVGLIVDKKPIVIDTEPVIIAVPDVQCTPETLNIKSKGKWVVCSLGSNSEGSFEGVEVGDFSLYDASGNSFVTEPSLSMDGDRLLVKFDRQLLIEEIESRKSPFPTFISFTCNGATDTIKLINPGKIKINKKKK